jgi:hypothetical protein
MAVGTQYRQSLQSVSRGQRGLVWVTNQGPAYYGLKLNYGDFLSTMYGNLPVAKGAYAAFESIWRQLTLDPAALGPTTYYVNATVNAVGTPAMRRGISFRFPTINATGTPSFSKGLLYKVSNVINAVGTVSFGKITVFGKALSYVGTGTVTLQKRIGKNFSVAATGTASALKRVGKTLSFSGSGTVTYSDATTFRRAFSVVGTGVVSLVVNVLVATVALRAKARRLHMQYIRRR